MKVQIQAPISFSLGCCSLSPFVPFTMGICGNLLFKGGLYPLLYMIYSCIYLLRMVCMKLGLDNHCHHILHDNTSCHDHIQLDKKKGIPRHHFPFLNIKWLESIYMGLFSYLYFFYLLHLKRIHLAFGIQCNLIHRDIGINQEGNLLGILLCIHQDLKINNHLFFCTDLEKNLAGK